MNVVRAKKNLGQHFLTDLNIAKKIVGSLSPNTKNILEIGPGMGVLTKYLIENKDSHLLAVDVDRESVDFLKQAYPEQQNQFILGDFLNLDPTQLFGDEKFSVIGNFPYNISSQIFFKVLEHKNQIPEVVGMIQKEVAERLASPPGKKAYGILSVLLQAYYEIEYLFTVHENVFKPPPKVKSAVIRLKRNPTKKINCDEVLFKKLIKASFNQRRKMIRNSIKPFINGEGFASVYLEKRPEQLSVDEFVELTNEVFNFQNK